VLHHTSVWLTLALGLLLLGIGMLLGRRINLNIFSLHGGYRDRLIRAFLGASRPHGTRRPNPFTGFDPADDLHMHELRPALLDEGDLVSKRKLAEALLNEKNPLSKYLLDKGLLENVRAQDKSGPLMPSSALTAALRNDLNSILEDEKLYLLVLAEDKQQKGRKYVASVAKDKDKDEEFDASHFTQSLVLADSRRARRIWRRLMRELNIERMGDEIESAAGGLPSDASDAERAVGALRKLADVPLRSDYHILLNRLVLEGAYPRLLKAGQFPPPPYRLMHVVNTTLNLVGGDKLAWQQRKAEPFSMSPLHSGCFRLGYRKSKDYGGRDTGGVTIGTAAATSGAAASSNMGYYTTSPVISLLLTLFNVRLGWWLGNPGPAGDTTYHLGAPKYSVAPVLYEAFGLTNDRSKYVYLTDGGHFENLAVYEMVLRRCRFIVVSDAAADEEYHFTDLANAVRKIRIDLGVTIDFPCVKIYGKARADEKGPGMYWALGRIRYSSVDRVRPGDGPRGLADDSGLPRDNGVYEGVRRARQARGEKPFFTDADDGILIYIKPAVYGEEPRDVLEYKESFPSFPHQSTADQFFDEPQFESYRELGLHIMRSLCGESPSGDRAEPEEKVPDLPGLVKTAREELKRQCKPGDDEGKGDEPNRRLAELLRGMVDWSERGEASEGLGEKAAAAVAPERGEGRAERAAPDAGLPTFFDWMEGWLKVRDERQRSRDRDEEAAAPPEGGTNLRPEGGEAGSE
jgi:hypothetical protein